MVLSTGWQAVVQCLFLPLVLFMLSVVWWHWQSDIAWKFRATSSFSVTTALILFYFKGLEGLCLGLTSLKFWLFSFLNSLKGLLRQFLDHWWSWEELVKLYHSWFLHGCLKFLTCFLLSFLSEQFCLSRRNAWLKYFKSAATCFFSCSWKLGISRNCKSRYCHCISLEMGLCEQILQPAWWESVFSPWTSGVPFQIPLQGCLHFCNENISLI